VARSTDPATPRGTVVSFVSFSVVAERARSRSALRGDGIVVKAVDGTVVSVDPFGAAVDCVMSAGAVGTGAGGGAGVDGGAGAVTGGVAVGSRSVQPG
jgi:hypothetical protein